MTWLGVSRVCARAHCVPCEHGVYLEQAEQNKYELSPLGLGVCVRQCRAYFSAFASSRIECGTAVLFVLAWLPVRSHRRSRSGSTTTMPTATSVA